MTQRHASWCRNLRFSAPAAIIAALAGASCGGTVEYASVTGGGSPIDSGLPADAKSDANKSPPDAPGDGGTGGAAGSHAGGDPPSCGGAKDGCGSFFERDCCQSTLVSGGSFHRSYDGVTYMDESYPATVSDFRLDVFEVSVSRFRNFLEGGGGILANPPTDGSGANRNIPGSGWQSSWSAHLLPDSPSLESALVCGPNEYVTWTHVTSNHEGSRPINCVTWFEAFAFCIWDGGRLPTEAEWNYAASGGAEQRVYPWSVPPASPAIDHLHATYGPNWGHPEYAGILSPNGDGRFGQADLAGNVWEWTLDWYAVPYGVPCTDCANLSDATRRVFRGGSFNSPPELLLTSYRHRGEPAQRSIYVGFRCARGA